MKKRLASGYTFSAAAKTVFHADFSDIGLAGVQLIANVTTNEIIYQFNNPAKGGSLSGDTLTLDFDTTSMSDTDKLMILVEDGSSSLQVSVGGQQTDALTDAELRASPVEVSVQNLSQPLEDGGNVAVTSSVLPTGAATAAKQDTGNTSLASIDTKIPASPATAGNQTTANTSLSSIDTKLSTVANANNQSTLITNTGATNESPPATDTGTSGLNGRLQRVAQRLTTLIGLLPGSLGQKARASSLAVTLSSEDVTALTPPAAITGYATSANQTTANTSLSSIDGKLTIANTATAKISPTVTVINGSTAETTVLSAIASTFLDVYGATFTNTSTTATKVTLKDDTAGTTRWTAMVPATETRGFMLSAESAIPQAVSNKPWTVTCGTSVSSLEVTLFATKR